MGNWLDSEVLTQGAPVALGLIGLVVFLEDALFVGFVLPGETAALLAGVVASQDAVPLWAALLVVIACAIAGDSVGYELGSRFGPRILAMRPLARRRQKIDEAGDYLRRRGGWAVFAGRWVAFFRAVMPGLAGMSHMPYRTFLAFNALGGLAWGTTFVLLGYFAGNAWTEVEHIGGRIMIVVLVGAVITGVVVLVARHRRAAREPA